MYTQRFFEKRTSKIILTILTALVLGFSAIHFAYAGYYGRLLDLYGDNFFHLDKSLFEKLYAPPIAYFTITGVAQVVINVFYLLMLWEVIQLTKIRLGAMIAMIICQFGMNFTVAVCASVYWTYYQGLWKDYLNWTEAYLNSLNIKWRFFHNYILNLYKLCIAQTIIAFLLVLPIIIIQILLFFDRNVSYAYLQEVQLKQNVNNDMNHNETRDNFEVKHSKEPLPLENIDVKPSRS